MRIVVLLKQTFDTEEKIILRDGRIHEEGVKWIINPYDEYALEAAIRLKEAHGGSTTVTAVTVGPERSVEALRTALAMGADEAVFLREADESMDEGGIAALLAAYIASSDVNLVIGGYFSTDSGSGQVAIQTAARLGWPHCSAITSLTLENDRVLVKRDAEGDEETWQVKLPAVLTAQQGLNEPRYPTLPGIMKARKKPLLRLTPSELAAEQAMLKAATIREAIQPVSQRQMGVRLQGEVTEQVRQLLDILLNRLP